MLLGLSLARNTFLNLFCIRDLFCPLYFLFIPSVVFEKAIFSTFSGSFFSIFLSFAPRSFSSPGCQQFS